MASSIAPYGARTSATEDRARAELIAVVFEGLGERGPDLPDLVAQGTRPRPNSGCRGSLPRSSPIYSSAPFPFCTPRSPPSPTR